MFRKTLPNVAPFTESTALQAHNFGSCCGNKEIYGWSYPPNEAPPFQYTVSSTAPPSFSAQIYNCETNQLVDVIPATLIELTTIRTENPDVDATQFTFRGYHNLDLPEGKYYIRFRVKTNTFGVVRVHDVVSECFCIEDKRCCLHKFEFWDDCDNSGLLWKQDEPFKHRFYLPALCMPEKVPTEGVNHEYEINEATGSVKLVNSLITDNHQLSFRHLYPYQITVLQQMAGADTSIITLSNNQTVKIEKIDVADVNPEGISRCTYQTKLKFYQRPIIMKDGCCMDIVEEGILLDAECLDPNEPHLECDEFVCQPPTVYIDKCSTNSVSVLLYESLDEGADFVNFKYLDLANEEWVEITSSTFTISDLEPCTSYNFQFASCCTDPDTGQEIISAVTTFTATTKCIYCPKPTFANRDPFSDITYNSATLNYGIPENDTPTVVCIRIRPASSTNPDDWTLYDNISTNPALPSEFTFSDLDKNTAYTVQIKTKCGADAESDWCTLQFTTLNPIITYSLDIGDFGCDDTNAPTTISDIQIDGVIVISYTITLYDEVGDVVDSSTNFPLSDGLAEGTYTLVIESGDCNTTQTFTIRRVCKCTTPVNVQCGTATEDTLYLNWDDVVSADSYNIRYRKIGETTWQTASTFVSQYPLMGLDCGSSYEIQVQTVCGLVTSEFTNDILCSTEPCCDIPNPTPLYNIIDENTVQITWDAIAGSNGYEVTYAINGGTPVTETTTNSQLTITSTEPCQTVDVTVVSIC